MRGKAAAVLLALYSPRVRGKAGWCVVVAAALSLSGVRAQQPAPRTYQEIVDEFRVNPDRAIGHMLELPNDVVARGVEDAARRGSVWLPAARGAALVMHTDAALYLQHRDPLAAWVHVERATTLADGLAQDPESAWLAHQWFIVVNVAFKDDARVPALVEHWHAESWYAATAAMDRGLDLESSGAQFGSSRPTRGTEMEMYDPDAFRQAEGFYRQAIAAHLQIAAVHLGRIQLLRGRTYDARQLFAQAADTSHWRTTTYLANLFLGSVEEREQQWPRAERRYRTAVASIGAAQSGRLALAVLLARDGRSAEAARVLAERRTDLSSALTFDPWWSYLYPYGDRRFGSGMILSELHVAVAR